MRRRKKSKGVGGEKGFSRNLGLRRVFLTKVEKSHKPDRKG